MRWPAPLIAGRLVRRYKRFLVDVALEDGALVTAHCPNPGRLLGVDRPGSRVWLSRSPNPRRALPLTLEIIEAEGGVLVGINTMRPNGLVEEGLRAGAIAELAGYGGIRREVAYGERSRVDLVLSRPGAPDCYVEVKNVHLKREGRLAEFPDCVTARGARHLRELAALVGLGLRAVVVYVVQRGDCLAFRPAADIDPAFAGAFRAAVAGGIEALCLSCAVGLDEIRLAKPLPIVL